MNEKQLMDILSVKGWGYKFPLHSKYIDYVKYNEVVSCPKTSVIIIAYKYDDMILQCVTKLKQQINNESEIEKEMYDAIKEGGSTRILGHLMRVPASIYFFARKISIANKIISLSIRLSTLLTTRFSPRTLLLH